MGTGSQSGSYHTDNNKGINTKVTDKEICTGVKKNRVLFLQQSVSFPVQAVWEALAENVLVDILLNLAFNNSV